MTPGESHVATAERSLASLDGHGAGGVAALEPVAERTGGAGGARPRAAGGGRWPPLWRGGPAGRATAGRHDRPLGQPLQPRRARRRSAAPRRRPARALRRRPAAADPGRARPPPGSGARRHRHLVADDTARGPAPGRRWPARGQHRHPVAHPARRRPELAEGPHLVRHRGGRAPAQEGRRGQRDRSGRRRKKTTAAKPAAGRRVVRGRPNRQPGCDGSVRA